MSNDKKNRIDEYFRAGLNNLDVVPPPEAWDHIAASLDNKGKSRKIIFWIAMAATIAVFAGISSIFYFQGTSGKKVIVNASIVPANHNQPNTKENASVASSSSIKGAGDQIQNSTSKDHLAKTNSKDFSNAGNLNSKVNSSNPKTEPEIAGTSFSSIASGSSGNQKVEKEKTMHGKATASLPQNVLVLVEMPEYVYIPRPIPGNLIENPYLSTTPVLYLPVVKTDTTSVYDSFIVMEDSEEPTVKINKWAIGGQMAPLYSYRNVSAVDIPGVNKAAIDKVEKAAITYASGILVDYSASSRLSFQTGIYYMEMGQEVSNISYLNGTNTKSLAYDNSLAQSNNTTSGVTNSTGTIKTPSGTNLYFSGSSTSDRTSYSPGNLALSPADNNTKYNIQQAFEFIEVPFLTKYKLIDRKLGLHVLGGVSTHVLVGSRTDVSAAGNSEATSTDGLKQVNYSSSVGFGVVYKLKGNFILSLEPVFKYYINSFNTAETIKTHPYALGFYSGFSYRF